MDSKNAASLTLMDIAILADGQGNIPHATAQRLAPFFRQDDRIRHELAQLERMAEDAGVRFRAAGLDACVSVTRLRQGPWKSTKDILDPRLETPHVELISMAGALAARAEGQEKAELRELAERLAVDLRDSLMSEKSVELLIARLVEVREEDAEEALEELARRYRDQRALASGPGESASASPL